MSTSPESPSAQEDRLVTVLSHWLARHADDDEVRRELETADRAALGPEGAEAVEDLIVALRGHAADRGRLERLVRETLEALALGA